MEKAKQRVPCYTTTNYKIIIENKRKIDSQSDATNTRALLKNISSSRNGSQSLVIIKQNQIDREISRVKIIRNTFEECQENTLQATARVH